MKDNIDEWYRQRRYLHFDRPVSKKTVESIILSPEKVKKHSFYPFITGELEEIVFSRDSDNEINYIEKARPIAYAAHVDSHIYSYYSWKLGTLYEAELEHRAIGHSVLAFRPLQDEDGNGKCNIDFAFEAFCQIKQMRDVSALALDITGFFDNLDHEILKQAWKNLLEVDTLPPDSFAVYKSLTKYSIVDKKLLYENLGISIHNPRKNSKKRICTPTEFREIRQNVPDLIQKHSQQKGIPQGSSISALLSNIYMIEFDEIMVQLMQEYKGKYYRYCDDMLFVFPRQEKSILKQAIHTEIEKLKLEIKEEKTKEVDFQSIDGKLKIVGSNKPLIYLGFTFDGENILIRPKALSRYYRKMKQAVKLAKRSRVKANIKARKNNRPELPLYKKQLYSRYSYLGPRNFISYALRSSRKMNSEGIRKQIKPHWKVLQKLINS